MSGDTGDRNKIYTFAMSSLKVIVMGVGGVGKSAITNRFVVGRWIEKVYQYVLMCSQ